MRKWCLQEMQASIENPHSPRNKFQYLRNEHSATDNDGPVFQLVDPRAQFHLYVSQAPCGDATTASLARIQTEESRTSFINGQQGLTDATVNNIARSQSQLQSQSLAERIEPGLKRDREETEDGKLDQDTSSSSKHPRTDKIESQHTAQSETSISEYGCNHVLGFRRGRIDYDSVGVLRTKPGRVDSEPTMSMSCSDKIARWNILGLTSALVVPFLSPIYLNSVITRELFDATALKRALFERIKDCQCSEASLEGASEIINDQPYKSHQINIYESDIAFEFSKEIVAEQCKSIAVNTLPVPSPRKVIANGCKAGASTKKQLPPKARSKLCKISMFKASVDLWESLPRKPGLGQRLSEVGQGSDKITYIQWKRLAKDYTKAKEGLFKGVFRNWVKNDASLEEFNLLGKSSLKP
ncbi:tRNA-specific adenosine deaminase 1 [Haplosporangium sp. Z 767]|nr:tRNA-specific adenosine deaminase 1 [Haplosporangium sp. Z 767]KAF9195529.1 tRNA-specific adenosine deaminase 1 [Haplosporangium sp. Z 11]